MSVMNVDPVMERYGPPVTLPLPPWLVEARGAVTTVADELRRIDDDELARAWRRDDPHGEAEVRYVFYRALEAFERAAGLAERDVGAAGPRHEGSRPFALATIARWDWHGLLTSLDDADLDADPGGGEWTVRQTLAHTVNVQRAYPSFSAWWLSRDDGGDLPAQVPDEVGEGFPDEAEEGAGSLGEIRSRLDAAMDGAAERLAILDDSRLATPARWSGFAVDVGFRLGPHVVPSPGAHGAGREDPGHARPRVPRDRSAAATRAPRLWAARVGGVRRAAVPRRCRQRSRA